MRARAGHGAGGRWTLPGVTRLSSVRVATAQGLPLCHTTRIGYDRRSFMFLYEEMYFYTQPPRQRRAEQTHRLTLIASRRRLLLRAVLGAVVAFVSRPLRPL